MVSATPIMTSLFVKGWRLYKKGGGD